MLLTIVLAWKGVGESCSLLNWHIYCHLRDIIEGPRHRKRMIFFLFQLILGVWLKFYIEQQKIMLFGVALFGYLLCHFPKIKKIKK